MLSLIRRDDYEIAKQYFETDREKAIQILQDTINKNQYSKNKLFLIKSSLALLYSLENSIKQTVDTLQDLFDIFINNKIDPKLFKNLFSEFNRQTMDKTSQKYNSIKIYELYFLILTKEEKKADEILAEISPFFERKIKLSDHLNNKIAILYYQIKLMIAYNTENSNDIIAYSRKLYLSHSIHQDNISFAQFCLGLGMDYFKRKVYTKAFNYYYQIINSQQNLRESYRKYVLNNCILSFILIDESKKEKESIIIDVSKINEADNLYQQLFNIYLEKDCDKFKKFITESSNSFPLDIRALLLQKTDELYQYHLGKMIEKIVSQKQDPNQTNEQAKQISIPLKLLSEEISVDEEEIEKCIISHCHSNLFIDDQAKNIIYVQNNYKDVSHEYQKMKELNDKSKELAKLAKLNYSGIF